VHDLFAEGPAFQEGTPQRSNKLRLVVIYYSGLSDTDHFFQQGDQVFLEVVKY